MNLDLLIPDYVRHFQAYQPSRPDHVLKEEYGTSVLARRFSMRRKGGSGATGCDQTEVQDVGPWIRAAWTTFDSSAS